jgi:hypothetical protein
MRSNSCHSHQIAGWLAASVLLISALARSQTAPGKGQVPPALEKVADIPKLGPAVRFDYQSLDEEAGRIYISHMNAHQMVVDYPPKE